MIQASDRDRFGRELRRWRERTGLTQLQLAARLGYDHTYISKIESGHRSPRIDFASRADGLLNADGSLIAAATNVLAHNRPLTVLSGAVVTPLRQMAETAYLRELSSMLRRGRLPALGVTCPLHDDDRCEADSPVATLAEFLVGAGRTTIGVDAVHGLITVLRGFIDADRRRSTTDVVPVEQTLGAVIGLMPRARGRTAVGGPDATGGPLRGSGRMGAGGAGSVRDRHELASARRRVGTVVR
jgi:transcriptional regulator with XRE-family HTH domain